jgi:hypothetical protein
MSRITYALFGTCVRGHFRALLASGAAANVGPFSATYEASGRP